MARLRICWVLASLLLLQSGLAAAHCLTRAGTVVAETMALCTPAGLRVAGSDPPSGAPQAVLPEGFCPACGGLPAVILPPAPLLPRPTFAVVAAAGSFVLAAAISPETRDPARGPRGPPSTV